MAKTKYGNLTITRVIFGTPVEIGVTEDEVCALYDEVCKRTRDRHLGTIKAMVHESHKAFPKMPNEHEVAK
jgi:hypothetical protein